jgi:NADPH:quinone reductase-like Zn-dependent oxidoreductase
MDNRVVRIHRLGGPEVLSLEQAEPKEPAAGEALVRIGHRPEPFETVYRSGKYLIPPAAIADGLRSLRNTRSR